jgi:hypothetical protein
MAVCDPLDCRHSNHGVECANKQLCLFWECSPADGAVAAFTPRGLRHIHAGSFNQPSYMSPTLAQEGSLAVGSGASGTGQSEEQSGDQSNHAQFWPRCAIVWRDSKETLARYRDSSGPASLSGVVSAQLGARCAFLGRFTFSCICTPSSRSPLCSRATFGGCPALINCLSLGRCAPFFSGATLRRDPLFPSRARDVSPYVASCPDEQCINETPFLAMAALTSYTENASRISLLLFANWTLEKVSPAGQYQWPNGCNGYDWQREQLEST